MRPLRMLGHLMLMFLLCEADSTCPTESNPLTVHPPEVIGEYGESVMVNCTSAELIFEEMYWRSGTTTSEKEEEQYFIGWSVPLSDWHVTAECVIKLNDSTECSKDAKITVYKNPVKVDLFPTKHTNSAVAGKPYELQCDIQEVAPVRNLIVRWYIDNQYVKMDSFTNTSKTPVNTSSTVTVTLRKDQHEAQVRCEAQLDFGPSGPQLPAMSATYNVSVHYAPELKNPDNIVVREGDDITLTCEVEANPPPVFNWTRDRVNMLENTNELNVIRIKASTTYSCVASNYLGSITKIFNVRVIPRPTAPAAIPTTEASPKKGCPLVLMPAEAVVKFGDPVSVNCSTTDLTHFEGMGWEAPFGGTGFENSSLVTWKVEKLQEWTIESKCYVTLTYDQCSVKPNITVYKTPDAVTVSALDGGPMVEGTEYKLNCDIINVAPQEKLQVKWYKGSEMVHTQTFNDTSVTPVNVSSTLIVTPSRNDDRALFKCVAELHLRPKGPELVPAEESSPYTAVVHYAPVFKEENYTVEVTVDGNVTFECHAEGNPAPEIRWKYTSADNVMETTGGRQKNITVTGATSTNAGVYICVATNKVGSVARSVTLVIKGKTPPFRAVIIWILIIILIIVIILLLIAFYRNRRKKL